MLASVGIFLYNKSRYNLYLRHSLIGRFVKNSSFSRRNQSILNDVIILWA